VIIVTTLSNVILDELAYRAAAVAEGEIKGAETYEPGKLI
jgi:hypothetical protein